jgi:hypothetical protein
MGINLNDIAKGNVDGPSQFTVPAKIKVRNDILRILVSTLQEEKKWDPKLIIEFLLEIDESSETGELTEEAMNNLLNK